MKKAAYGLVAAFLASGVYGGIPSSAERWYTPENGFLRQAGSGTVYYLDDATGEEKSVSVSVDNFGNVSGGMSSIGDPSLKTAYDALVKACANQAYNAVQDEAIETIGKNLYELTSKTGIEITNPETGRKFTIKFSSGTMAQTVGQSTGNIPATSDAEDPADLKTLNWTDDSESSKLQLYGANTATSSTADWWDDYDFFVPFLKGNGALGWKRYGGWQSDVFESVVSASGSKLLSLSGWNDESPSCDTDFQTILTNRYSGTDRQEHWVLTRYKHGSSGPVVHWVPFDEGALDMREPAPDDKSVEYTQDEYALADDPKKFRIKGFDAANDAAASDPKSAKLPIADGSTDIAWKKPVDLFNSSVFDADSSGKVILKATVAENNKTELMTITQNSGSGGVTSQTLEGKTLDYLTDNASLGAVEVSGDDKIGIKGWDRPQDARASYTVASRLKLQHTDALDNPTLTPAVVVRDNGVLKYAAMGCIDPIPPIDGVSITTNSEDGAVANGVLSVFGYANAEEGDYLHMGAEGLEWGALAPYDLTSVDTNSWGEIGLVGFEDAVEMLEAESDGALIPFVDATSPALQWGGMMEFFADSVFRQSETTGKILLNGTSEEGKVKVLAMTGTGGDDQNVSALTFDSSSIDGVVGGYVQLHGFDTAVSPYTSGDVSFADVLTNTATQITGMSVPVRVPEQGAPAGYAVKYVPMGKITGIPAAAVDNKTIEVNEEDPQNPFLQLHGAAGDGITLEEGDVYMIGSDGKGKFGKQCAADGDDSEVSVSGENSLESYTNSEGERFFRIKGWDVNREGTPHLLGWEANEMHYFEADGSGGVETKTTIAGDSVQLAGHDSAGEGAIPYAKKDGNGLGWLAGVDDRVPLLHANSAPTTMALGGSLDKANVSAVPTLNVSGFTSGGNCTTSLNKMLSDPDESSNRSAHQFMARYSSGGGTPSVHWVGIDGLIQGGSNDVYEAGTGISITDGTNAKEISANLSAGFGISITETAGGGLSISRQGEHDDAGAYSMITFISNIEWDGTTHQLKATKTTVSAKILSGATTTEEVIFTATSHAAEHDSE